MYAGPQETNRIGIFSRGERWGAPFVLKNSGKIIYRNWQTTRNIAGHVLCGALANPGQFGPCMVPFGSHPGTRQSPWTLWRPDQRHTSQAWHKAHAAASIPGLFGWERYAVRDSQRRSICHLGSLLRTGSMCLRIHHFIKVGKWPGRWITQKALQDGHSGSGR